MSNSEEKDIKDDKKAFSADVEKNKIRTDTILIGDPHLTDLRIETENTIKVLDMLKKHTDKRIFVKDIRKFANDPTYSGAESYLGAVDGRSDSIIVYLNVSKLHTCEATFVHEILHQILKYEGFPDIVIYNDIALDLPPQIQMVLPKLQSFFSSTIEHPEIFKRMASDFNLDLLPYYEVHLQQKIDRFKRRLDKDFKVRAEYYFYAQQDILDGLEYYSYPPKYREEILRIFKECSPDACVSCSFLYDAKIRKIGFNTPALSYESAKIIKDHIIKYGEKKSTGIFNKMWEALEIKKPSS
jgi:hypothetical protein